MKSETVFSDATPVHLSLGGGIYPNTPIPLSLKADLGMTVTKALDQLVTPAILVTTTTKVLPQLVTSAITATTATTTLPQLAFLAILTMVATYFTDKLRTLAILAITATFYLQQQELSTFLATGNSSKITWLGSLSHITQITFNNLQML
ncbi:hypothetical protein MMC12_006426 [Toensbergia leucococca]|nr:hypothetical protein [Toensbergia leucococca]